MITAAWVSVAIALPIFWLIGFYREIFRFSGLSIVLSVSVGTLLYSLLYICIFTLYSIEGVPRSIGILQPMLMFFGIMSSRLMAKYILGDNFKNKKKPFKTALIYGAGSAGHNLATALDNSFEFRVVGFLDDDEKLHGQYLYGKKIYDPNNLDKLIESKNIELFLLALPSVNRFKRNQILKKLGKYKLKIQTLPSVIDIIHGKFTISDIKELDVNDILDREIIPPEKICYIKMLQTKQ